MHAINKIITITKNKTKINRKNIKFIKKISNIKNKNFNKIRMIKNKNDKK